jgi:hypothetical protein
MEQCRALKKDGKRCGSRSKVGYGGFCGRHVPKDGSKLTAPESNTAKVRNYIAIASGIASLIKFVWDVIEKAGSIRIGGGPPPEAFHPFSHKIGTLHERYILFTSKAAQGDVPESELRDDAEMLDNHFDAWFLRLPVKVQNSIYKYLDKEKIGDTDREELRQDLFDALVYELGWHGREPEKPGRVV